MKTSISRVLSCVGASVFLLAVGFCFGNYFGGTNATYLSNAATLVWLTGIDGALNKGNLIDARQKTDAAIDGHVAALSALEKHRYLWFLVFNSPSMMIGDRSLDENILHNTDQYFAKMPERLRPETKEYLSRFGGDHHP